MKFIAHRGFSLRFAENSLPAFQAVVDHPCNGNALAGIELDIHLTGDERIAVMHDTVVKDENGKRVPVAQCTFEELQLRFRKANRSGMPPIPALEEVLELVNHKTELCFEIKEGAYDPERFARRFASVLSSYRPRSDVVVSSFSFDILKQVHPHLVHFDIRYGFIFRSRKELEDLPTGEKPSLDLLHPHYRLALRSPGLFPADGPALRCWTVNAPETVRRLIALTPRVPIEAIMTDDIDLAKLFS